MSTGLQANNPTIVSAFYSQLLRQGLVVVGIALVVLLAWALLRSAQLRQAYERSANGTRRLAAAASTVEAVATEAVTGAPVEGAPVEGAPVEGAPVEGASVEEAPGRHLLRVGFGVLWLFDGILQAQASMPLRMPSSVIEPAAASSPSWVQHIDEMLASFWSYHPVAVPAAAVWIQVGLGVWLLAASKGPWSRLAGVASAGWAAVIWAGGEAFGGIFSPGQSWLFGLPGAVLIYGVAGALVALPERSWEGPRLGRWLLRATGLFWMGMAVLQAWPGRGFWQGQPAPRTPPGTLTSMLREMSATPQPHVLASWVGSFASFDAAHGWGVNLFVVIGLFATGTLLALGHRRPVLVGLLAGAVLCGATWVLVQDLGFLGGVGTDPNTMPPMVLLLAAGYVAMTRLPAPAVVQTPPVAQALAGAAGAAGPTGPGPAQFGWRGRWAANPAYTLRCVLAAGAFAVMLVGSAPAALATTSPDATPLLNEAINGPNHAVDFPAPAISLVDQYGKPVSLGGLRGKVVVITFLDPVCTNQCPVIAEELKQVDRQLGTARQGHVELVALDANARYVGREFLLAFDSKEGLQGLHNWSYLTGALPQLEHAWRVLGATPGHLPGGAMLDHSEYAYVIGPAGHVRYDIGTDPGPATAASKSSFVGNLVDVVEGLLPGKPGR
jgi:cytochrome oxidase Cu insertion factor (SCO1/SenC/PrrC family)